MESRIGSLLQPRNDVLKAWRKIFPSLDSWPKVPLTDMTLAEMQIAASPVVDDLDKWYKKDAKDRIEADEWIKHTKAEKIQIIYDRAQANKHRLLDNKADFAPNINSEDAKSDTNGEVKEEAKEAWDGIERKIWVFFNNLFAALIHWNPQFDEKSTTSIVLQPGNFDGHATFKKIQRYLWSSLTHLTLENIVVDIVNNFLYYSVELFPSLPIATINDPHPISARRVGLWWSTLGIWFFELSFQVRLQTSKGALGGIWSTGSKLFTALNTGMAALDVGFTVWDGWSASMESSTTKKEPTEEDRILKEIPYYSSQSKNEKNTKKDCNKEPPVFCSTDVSRYAFD